MGFIDAFSESDPNPGVRDLFILGDRIFVSVVGSYPYTKNCMNTFVLSAKLNIMKIDQAFDFSLFYAPPDCINTIVSDPEPGDFYQSSVNILNSGGRIASIGEDHLLLTIGVYSDINPATKRADSSFGKLVEINVETGHSRYIASGLRNSQGLVVYNDSKNVLMTDHGPKGGDEINILNCTGAVNMETLVILSPLMVNIMGLLNEMTPIQNI